MEEAVKLIGSGPLVVLAAIGIVCVPFLYFDVRKRSKELVKKSDDHAIVVQTMARECAEAAKKVADDHADALRRIGDEHAESLKLVFKTQQEQMERSNQRIDDLNREHKRELGGMVDRVVEAMKNSAAHQQTLVERTVALAESLERRVQGRGGR